MTNMIDRLVASHDMSLTAIAAIVCLVASMTAFRLFARGQASTGEARPAWFVLTGVAAGFGTWSTHILALLAFNPGVEFGMTPAPVFASLGVSVAMCTAAFLAAANLNEELRASIGGALFGLGVASMHYLTMAGFSTQGHAFNDPAYAFAAIGISAAISATGFGLAGEGETVSRQAAGGALLSVSVLVFHAIAMGGLTISPDISHAVQAGVMSKLALFVAIGSTMLVVVATGLGAALVDGQASERAVERLRRLANGAFEGIVISAHGKIVDVNTAYARLVGVESHKLIGQPVDSGLLNSRSDGSESVLTSADSELPIPVEVRARALSDDGAESVLAVRDLRDQRAAEDRIRFLANHDPLTGLPNRNAFQTRLAATLDHAAVADHGVALLYIDLDHFKDINDVHGHAAGDAVLNIVAARLRAAVDAPSFAARVGGDEFVVMFTGFTNATDVAGLSNRLLDDLRKPIEVDGRVLPLGASIGVSLFPDDAMLADDLLTNADIALYRAKAGGRNAACFFKREMDDAVRQRRSLAHDLRDAIAAQQLHIDYQPLVDLPKGNIVGFEALARWNHPTRGVVGPDEFILVAEENGLIGALGEWVLKQACAEAALWPLPLTVAVNFSALQVHQEDLPHRVTEILLETGLSPSRLEIEVTESALFRDQNRAIHNLRQLKMLGVRIAMDDFGTGFSSLATLQAFPFDKIKIDRSFVDGINTRDQSAAIVRAIVGLGKSLNVPVTAEGVETQAQLDYLRDQGCGQVQGFLLGRPMAIADQGRHVGLPQTATARVA